MADKRLKFAIVGVGGMGNNHIDGLYESEHAELTALCDPAGLEGIMKVRNASPQYKAKIDPKVNVYTDLCEMLEKEELDALIISSPDSTHRDYSLMAMSKGIHVLCEKPLTVTDEESADIVAAEKKYGVRAFAGQICRFAPSFIKAKELLDSGMIGELFCVESQYRHGCHANLPEDNWRKNPPRHATSCGGCHAIDIVRYFAGDPTEVFAFGNRKCRTDWVVEDASETVFKFENDVMARVFTTLGCIAPYSMATALYGTKGTIEVNNTSADVVVHTTGGRQIFTTEINTHNCALEIDDMCRAILFGDKVSHDIIEGAKTLVCCNAAIKSIDSGEKVVIDYSVLG
nr:Gfo/Idh/MocA family oxidoreductase [Clostridia bacterium]